MSQSEFTSNWLQALMLASDNASARRIRPWMTDIALLSAAEATAGQAEAAERLWEFGSSHGLGPLLQQIPLAQSLFLFQGDDSFLFHASPQTTEISDAASFVELLGYVEMERSWEAESTQADWTNLLRREAVRLGKGLNTQVIPDASMVRVPCMGCWNTRSWRIGFTRPDWLIIETEEVLQTRRPSVEILESVLLESFSYAMRSFKIPAKLNSFPPLDASWMASIASLYEWHRSILVTNEVGLDPWMRRVWAAVWPVVYRERNRLRGPCDLVELRKEVAECFRSAPLLTEWIFVFARLVCEVRCERGLGIAADFVDDFDPA
jgi:hypothetical protein